MTQDTNKTEHTEENKTQDNTGVMMTGHIQFLTETGEVMVDKRNAIP